MKSIFSKLLLLALILASCKNETKRQVRPAFYHWQTHLSLHQSEVSYLDTLNVQTIYAKFFDLDWDEGLNAPVPLAQISIDSTLPGNINLIPTIFITNRTFQQLKKEDIPALAQRVYDKILQLAEQRSNAISEIQIDCDWTAGTREAYFEFLKYLSEKPSRLSATIRLHQIKYFKKTGIPPVDRGMLMFYNVGQLEDWQAQNAILTIEEALPYLDQLSNYPLTLDLALPIFSWGVLFRRGQMIKLINNLRSIHLADTSRFLKIEPNRFRVIKSTYLDGRYLYKDDLIRVEDISMSTLQECVNILRDELKNPALTVAFYHLDTAIIKHYPHAGLEAIYQGFEQ